MPDKRTVLIPINLNAVKILLLFLVISLAIFLQLPQSKKPCLFRDRAFLNNFGGDLLSHTVAHAVSSAQ